MYRNFNGFKEFLQAAFRDPRGVSTLFPTLRFLGQALVNEAQIDKGNRVLELGCGTGAITRHIMAQRHSFDDFIGVEIDPYLVKYLEKTFPTEKFLAASAADLKEHIPDGSMDVVLSSLPWTMFAGDLQEAIVAEISRVLKPGGRFVTFICLHALPYPGAGRAKEIFKSSFNTFEKKRTITRNLPPANIYLAVK